MLIKSGFKPLPTGAWQQVHAASVYPEDMFSFSLRVLRKERRLQAVLRHLFMSFIKVF